MRKLQNTDHIAWMLAALLLLLPARQSGATTVEDVRFEPRYHWEDITLHLRGAGILRYMLFIKAYAGALYLPPEIDRQTIFGDTPRRLAIAYFHAIEAADLAEATERLIRRNLGARAYEALRPRVEAFNRAYRDVQPGDRYALTFFPERGTELTLNGQSLITIAGVDFADAVFAIWLGENPIDRSFRDALLGGPK